MGAARTSSFVFVLGSTGARFDLLPRSAPSRDSNSSSATGASTAVSSARARVESRAGGREGTETRAVDARRLARDAEAPGAAADATTRVATRVVMANMALG